MVTRKLFVSFSSQDMDYAEAFVESLAQQIGHDAIFFSPHNIGPGVQYFDPIMQYLSDCDAVILLASATSVGCTLSNTSRSVHVMRELKNSLDLNKPIFPVDIDGVLKRGSCDDGIGYMISCYQYLDGEVASFTQVIEPLLAALAGEQAEINQHVVEERLRKALEEGRISDAVTISQSLNTAKLNGDAAMLSVLAILLSSGSLESLRLTEAEQLSAKIYDAFTRGCSSVGEGLGLYMAGLLSKEYFQKRVVQCPLGSYHSLKERAQQLPRLSITNKKLVRALSKDYRSFEADWFFGRTR